MSWSAAQAEHAESLDRYQHVPVRVQRVRLSNAQCPPLQTQCGRLALQSDQYALNEALAPGLEATYFLCESQNGRILRSSAATTLVVSTSYPQKLW